MSAKEVAHLTIYAKDGTKVSYTLKKQPSVRFTATEIIVASEETTIIYTTDKVGKFVYESFEEHLGLVNLSNNEKIFRITDDAIVFPHLNKDSQVEMYTPEGKIVFHKNIPLAGEYMFPLTNVAKGVYLVKVNGLIYKVIRK